MPRRDRVLLEAELVFLDDVGRSVADSASWRLVLRVLGLVEAPGGLRAQNRPLM